VLLISIKLFVLVAIDFGMNREWFVLMFIIDLMMRSAAVVDGENDH